MNIQMNLGTYRAINMAMKPIHFPFFFSSLAVFCVLNGGANSHEAEWTPPLDFYVELNQGWDTLFREIIDATSEDLPVERQLTLINSFFLTRLPYYRARVGQYCGFIETELQADREADSGFPSAEYESELTVARSMCSEGEEFNFHLLLESIEVAAEEVVTQLKDAVLRCSVSPDC